MFQLLKLTTRNAQLFRQQLSFRSPSVGTCRQLCSSRKNDIDSSKQAWNSEKNKQQQKLASRESDGLSSEVERQVMPANSNRLKPGQFDNNKIVFSTMDVKLAKPQFVRNQYQDFIDILKSYQQKNFIFRMGLDAPIALIEFTQLPKQEKIDRSIRKGINYLYYSLAFILINCLGIYYHWSKNELTDRDMIFCCQDATIHRCDTILSEATIEQFEGRFVGSDDPSIQKMDSILRKLIADSKDYVEDERLKEPHACILIQDQKLQEITLYSHKFLVFTTAVLDLCENDDQLAYVIANSFSHYLLKHKREPLSNLEISFSDIWKGLRLYYYFTFWGLMSRSSWFGETSVNALKVLDEFDKEVSMFFYRKFRKIDSTMVYGRTLEEEADRVALQLLARSCYDVREVEKFSKKCAALAEIERNKPVEKKKKLKKGEKEPPTLPVQNYLLQHRFGEEKLTFIQSLMSKIIEFRLTCKCPPLS